MDMIGWLFVILIVYLLGKGNIMLPELNMPQSIPLPQGSNSTGGLPASTTQNQRNRNTANAPAPWTQSRACKQSTVMKVDVNPVQRISPMNGVVKPLVTFEQ